MISALCALDSAPDFSLPTTDGIINLSSLQDRFIILYFYPKDGTPGCTQEACDFRDSYAHLRDLAFLIGISRDTLAQHNRFKTQHQLPFVLASDAEGEVCQKYGVWVLKKSYGKSYMGLERATFLIKPGLRIEKIWRKVRVKGHVQEVLKALVSAVAQKVY